jgi:ATP-dependent helicase STH1/SNF2
VSFLLPATMGDGSFDTTIDVTQDKRVKEGKENDSTISTSLDALKPYSALIHPSNTIQLTEKFGP